MKYCKNCDTPYRIDNNYCPFCGKTLIEVPDDSVKEEDVYDETDVINIINIIETY
jgi:rRNA maturation endonuclease Nob1